MSSGSALRRAPRGKLDGRNNLKSSCRAFQAPLLKYTKGQEAERCDEERQKSQVEKSATREKKNFSGESGRPFIGRQNTVHRLPLLAQPFDATRRWKERKIVDGFTSLDENVHQECRSVLISSVA